MLLLTAFETLYMNIMAFIDSTDPEQVYNNEAPTYQELNFLVYLFLVFWKPEGNVQNTDIW